MSVAPRTGQLGSRTVAFEDNRLIATVYGQHDRNLARLEQQLGVVMINRGNRIVIEGRTEACELAVTVLTDLYDMAKQGHVIDLGDVDGAVRLAEEGRPAIIRDDVQPIREAAPAPPRGSAIKVKTKNKTIMPRSKGQADYLTKLADHDLVFGVGPAGTGKTYLAVAMAVARLITGDAARIILTRPAVEAGENLGFLPGDLKDKVDPYMQPLYDALFEMLGGEQVEKRIASKQIEIAPLAYMRGRTLKDAYIILDEAQNTTSMQMKMFLTRFGENSRMVICGDPSQIDLPPKTKSGLIEALNVLDGVDGIAMTYFKSEDVIRHELVKRIVDAYDSAEGDAP